MLFLVATPIGNLSDFSLRAIEVLNEVDYILCEDTRHSLKLLQRHSIQKHLESYHKFNEEKKTPRILNDLKQEKKIALISDAGTPGISDPGERLIKKCWKNKISITAIPGPCALIAALTLSGFSTELFQFFGFLPKKTSERKKKIQTALMYEGTSIFYESPQRIAKTLPEIANVAPEREVFIARELTKKFEELKKGTAKQLANEYSSKTQKGEFVLCISGETNPIPWETLNPKDHVKQLQDAYLLDKKEAIKIAAELRNVPKKTLYE